MIEENEELREEFVYLKKLETKFHKEPDFYNDFDYFEDFICDSCGDIIHNEESIQIHQEFKNNKLIFICNNCFLRGKTIQLDLNQWTGKRRWV